MDGNGNDVGGAYCEAVSRSTWEGRQVAVGDDTLAKNAARTLHESNLFS
jgi:hypothetical protein